MTWDSQNFQAIINNKLEHNAITKLYLNGAECSSVALNEMLAVINANISEEHGLQEFFLS